MANVILDILDGIPSVWVGLWKQVHQKKMPNEKKEKKKDIIFAILPFSHTNILTKLIAILSTLESTPLDAISDVHQNGSF